MVRTLQRLGAAYLVAFQGDLPQARAYFDAARRRFQALGDQLYEAQSKGFKLVARQATQALATTNPLTPPLG